MTKKYQAEINSLNGEKIGTHPTGEATFTVDGDTLTVEITMDHTSPNTQHWMHFHGFPDGKDAQPATIAQDTNHDGYVDLPETEPVSGTTMVPFNDAPEKMDIQLIPIQPRMPMVISITRRKCLWLKLARNSKKSLMMMIYTSKNG